MDENPYAEPTKQRVRKRRRRPLASHGARFAGAVIDRALGLGALLVGVPIMALDPGFRDRSTDPGPMETAGAVICFVALIALVGVQWYWITTRGQSIGKRITKTRIRKVDGSPVDFVSGVIMRIWIIGFIFAVAHVFTCGLFGWVVFVVDGLMILGAERQCLHDIIAGTQVVEFKGKRPARTPAQPV